VHKISRLVPCAEVGLGSTAVHPLSCGNRQQWVDCGPSPTLGRAASGRSTVKNLLNPSGGDCYQGCDLLDNWFDAIEVGLRERVREFIQAMLKQQTIPRAGAGKVLSGMWLELMMA
jgi:hypothetical protein